MISLPDRVVKILDSVKNILQAPDKLIQAQLDQKLVKNRQAQERQSELICKWGI